MNKLFRILALVILFSVAFYAIDAQASAETASLSKRGEGAGRISGYIISNIHYRLAENPSNIGAVELDLDGPASQVMIGFDTSSDQMFTCQNVGGQHWLCEVNDVKVALITNLRVIAIGQGGS